MQIRLNGKERDVEPGFTVRSLIESLGLNPLIIVVEKNREILVRDDYAETDVEEGDVFELVHFVGGG